jgi:ABC-type polysaccharide/polyol phosphate transport system ATPase subunit
MSDPSSSGKQVIISAKNLSKVFRIPHLRIQTARERFLNFWRKQDYEELGALKNVSFEVFRGEFYGVIGRNGSGKSTLLKILAGIYVPNEGEVMIRGSTSPFLGLGVGFHPDLSARENVFLNGAVLGLSQRTVESKFEEIITFAELSGFVDTKIRNFSSGMAMRLAFSIAIQANRDILLLDEALAVGDAGFRTKCYEVFRQIHAAGKTIVLVSHDLELVKQFCSRVAVLERGSLITVDSPDSAIATYERLIS